MLNLHVIYGVTIAIKWEKVYPNLVPRSHSVVHWRRSGYETTSRCQVSVNALYCASVCGLKNAQFWELREQSHSNRQSREINIIFLKKRASWQDHFNFKSFLTVLQKYTRNIDLEHCHKPDNKFIWFYIITIIIHWDFKLFLDHR